MAPSRGSASASGGMPLRDGMVIAAGAASEIS